MNRTGLVDEMASRANLSKVTAKAALDAFLETISDALTHSEVVQLIGFGTFKVNSRPARLGRNPRTGEAMKIAASKVPSFVAGKSLKQRVNQK